MPALVSLLLSVDGRALLPTGRLTRSFARLLNRRGVFMKRNYQCYMGLGAPTNNQAAVLPTDPLSSGDVTVEQSTNSASGKSSAAAKASSSSTATPAGSSSFKLVSSSEGTSFFDDFTFFTNSDPTNGFVQYIDQASARVAQLTDASGSQVFIKADNTTTLASAGLRKSVRIISKGEFNKGNLLLFDASHVPTGCALWPAFWLLGVGAEWPAAGEIDIYENINLMDHNQYTLHTDKGCKVQQPMPMGATGTVLSDDCDAYSNENAACGVADLDKKSAGKAFNDNQGGVFATLWDDSGISMWFFERQSVPDDIKSKSPNPSKWNIKPSAHFSASACDMTKYFKAQNWIVNLTFCGDWAGKKYSESNCPGTCADFMMDPTNFDEAFWLINSIRLYSST